MKLPRLWDSFHGLGSSLKPTKVVKHHEDYSVGETTGGLSVFFTVLCIIDLFGVFPVVALPKSIISCGVYGIPLVACVFALQLYTAVLLGRSWLLAQQISPQISQNNRSPYASVAELAFGPRARRLVTFLIDATVFGAGVPNLLVASQSLQLFWWKITGGEVGVSYCVWMLLIGLLLCPVMWLGSPKDMKPLALTSVFIVTTVAVCTWACILTDRQSPAPPVTAAAPALKDLLVAYGIIAFQFDIHPMLLTIQVDMKNSARVNTAVFAGFAASASMFAVTAALAAARYGQDVQPNILQGIPASVPLYVVALLVTLQLCLSSAVGNSALFQHVEHLLHVPRDFCVKRCIIRSSIVALAVFLGETVPRFDLVMGLVGSTLTGPLMFIFPPLFFLKLCYMKNYLENNDPDFPMTENFLLTLKNARNGIQNGDLSNRPLVSKTFKCYETFNYYEEIDLKEIVEYRITSFDVILATSVMFLGVAATFIATYSSWSDAITSASFTPPCLANATAAARIMIESVQNMQA